MKKIDIAKDVLKDLITDQNIAWGFGTWANVGAWAALAENPKTYTLIEAGTKSWTVDHYNRLDGAIGAVTPQDQTPFGPSIDGAWRYFKGLKKDNNPNLAGDEDGELFQGAACQPRFLINVTDGRGNQPEGHTSETYLDLVKANTNKLCDAGVSVVGIGFGMGSGGDDRAQLQAMAAVGNARGEQDLNDEVYAMHPKDGAGNAIAYMADTKEQLKGAFKDIIGSLKNANFFGSAPAVSSQPEFSDRVLVSSFNAAERTGDLVAIGRAPLGGWNEVIWKASENIPDACSIWTRKNNQIVAYNSGTLPNDHWKASELCKPIADIVNSAPVVVGTPPNYYNFDNKYKTFKKRYAEGDYQREALAYVASNDGLLHAFRVEDGVEKWAFLPPRLHQKLDSVTTDPATDMCADEYCYKYMLDGSPVIADIQGNFPSSNTGWGTILVLGQRQGGTAYTALDITTGNNFDHTPAKDSAKFLWDFTDTDLGETWSVPEIERVKVYNSTTDTSWGVFFGSGYAENDNSQPSKEAYLYGLQTVSGTPLWTVGGSATSKIKMSGGLYKLPYSNYTGPPLGAGWKVGKTAGVTCQYPIKSVDTTAKIIFFEAYSPPTCFASETYFSTINPSGVGSGNGLYSSPPSAVSQTNNVLSSPLAVDFEADHKMDRVYAGDLYGNMYRVGSIGKGESPAVSLLFGFNPAPASPEMTPIRGKASEAFENNDSHWVYYGTGRYETPADKATRYQQYFSGLKDTKTSLPTYALGSNPPIRSST
jgi:hypothetical protein